MSLARYLQRLHHVLRFASLIVPRDERSLWFEESAAELRYLLLHRPAEAQRFANGLLWGAIVRRLHRETEDFRETDWRAPHSCIASLIVTLAAVLSIAVLSSHCRAFVFSRWGWGALECFGIVALLSIPSTFATQASRFGDYTTFISDAQTFRKRSPRWLFLAWKLLLVLVTNYLLSMEITWAIMPRRDLNCEVFFLFCGLILNSLSLNWAMLDQKGRCPVCMRSLRNPARIGPPSWSFLAWTGVEEVCDRGHGLLHMPEWETSWFDSARWMVLDQSWRDLFTTD